MQNKAAKNKGLWELHQQKFTHIELKFAQLWIDRYPDIDLVTQYPVGRFRVDFCHLGAKVIVECQGQLPTLTFGTV